MYNIICETGTILNGMFNFIGASSFMSPGRTYGYLVTVILGLFLLVSMGKVVYCNVKDK